MPRHLIGDAHKWVNEISTVPWYSPRILQLVALKTISISRKRCRFKPPRWSVFFLIDTYTHSFIYICEHLQKFTYTFLYILLWTSIPCHKQWNINKYTNYHSYTSTHTMIHSQKHRHKTHTHEYIRYDLTYKYT